MQGECVVVLGAGATKACDGSLTNEILPCRLPTQLRLSAKAFSAQPHPRPAAAVGITQVNADAGPRSPLSSNWGSNATAGEPASASENRPNGVEIYGDG